MLSNKLELKSIQSKKKKNNVIQNYKIILLWLFEYLLFNSICLPPLSRLEGVLHPGGQEFSLGDQGAGVFSW